jgi:ABC-type transport system involved in cytochrome c biogenesis permease subunit
MTILYPVHLVFMILAFIVFASSFLTGLFFLLQENRIKNHRLTSFVRRLPALETIYALHYKILTAGFVLLSLGMIVGALLSKMREGLFFTGDPKEIGALVTWALYALFLNMRLKVGWRGRKGILLSLLGFVAVILTFLALEH